MYVIRKNKRQTIALKAVKRSELLVDVITELLYRVEKLQIEIKRLLLDRGFCSVPVIAWLKALEIPFLMPMIIRGKENSGSRKLLKTNRSYKTTYTMRNPKYGSITFDVWIICCYSKGKNGRYCIERAAYVVHQIHLRLGAIHNDYRKRFGIETSYRLKNLCRIKTTTRNPVIRLLFVGIAFLLVNLWVYILWNYISSPRKGGRIVYQHLFTLKRMLLHIRSAVELQFPVLQAVYLPES